MVWTAEQCGTFLDFAEYDRLYPLWHLDAHWGMRRGELVNLEKPDVSIARRRLHIREGEPDDELDDPKEGVKTENADRIVVFDRETALVLTAWQERQRFEQRQAGGAWNDSGRFFTREDDRPLFPPAISQRFAWLIRRYNAIRRHRFEDGWTIEQIINRSRVTRHEAEVALSGPPLPPLYGCMTCGTACWRPGWP